MSINRQTDEAGVLQIGPTTEGMVRLYVAGTHVDLPMDFDPDEAEEIAEEILAAARQARASGGKKSSGGKAKAPSGKSGERARARTGADGGNRQSRDDGERRERAGPGKRGGSGGPGGRKGGGGPGRPAPTRPNKGGRS